jgi:hypothetical protein
MQRIEESNTTSFWLSVNVTLHSSPPEPHDSMQEEPIAVTGQDTTVRKQQECDVNMQA